MNSNTEMLVSCRRCKILRPTSDFYSDERYANGWSWCRACETEKARRYRQSNRERLARQARARRRTSAELRQREAAKCAAWRAKNVNAVREYAKSPKERVRKLNLRAKSYGVEGRISIPQWQELLESYCHECAYCGRRATSLGHDHVIPMSRGGVNTIENLVPCCQSCNSSKRQRSLIEFLMWTSRRAA